MNESLKFIGSLSADGKDNQGQMLVEPKGHNWEATMNFRDFTITFKEAYEAMNKGLQELINQKKSNLNGREIGKKSRAPRDTRTRQVESNEE